MAHTYRNRQVFFIGTIAILLSCPLGCTTNRKTVATLSGDGPVITRTPDAGGEAVDVPRPDLRSELLAMMEVDQVARKKGMRKGGAVGDAGRVNVGDIDKRNLVRMKELVETYGWPTRSMVGNDGAHAAWLLVQHADRDAAFQRRCLDLMKALVDKGEVSRGDVAYLTDRVLVNEDKPQIYATQGRMVDGTWQPRPMIDPPNVDKRRIEAGLSTLKEYREMMRT